MKYTNSKQLKRTEKKVCLALDDEVEFTVDGVTYPFKVMKDKPNGELAYFCGGQPTGMATERVFVKSKNTFACGVQGYNDGGYWPYSRSLKDLTKVVKALYKKHEEQSTKVQEESGESGDILYKKDDGFTKLPPGRSFLVQEDWVLLTENDGCLQEGDRINCCSTNVDGSVLAPKQGEGNPYIGVSLKDAISDGWNVLRHKSKYNPPMVESKDSDTTAPTAPKEFAGYRILQEGERIKAGDMHVPYCLETLEPVIANIGNIVGVSAGKNTYYRRIGEHVEGYRILNDSEVMMDGDMYTSPNTVFKPIRHTVGFSVGDVFHDGSVVYRALTTDTAPTKDTTAPTKGTLDNPWNWGEFSSADSPARMPGEVIRMSNGCMFVCIKGKDTP